MYTIEFYEDLNGKSHLSDYIHRLHAAHRKDFYKMAAFLDYLTENGANADKVVGRYPDGIIRMHCIPGMEKLPAAYSACTGDQRAGPFPFQKSLRVPKRLKKRKTGSGSDKAVCIILYGQYHKKADREESFVLLHHFFADRIPGGVPILHMYLAVRKLQRYRETRRTQ